MQSYARIFETIRLYKLCKKHSTHCTILITGGGPQKNGLAEATVYNQKLLKLDIERHDVKLETQSFNAFQNAHFTSSIIKNIKGRNVILVSSAYHLKRSQLYFQHFGHKTLTSRSDYIHPYCRLFKKIFS
ncbi:YdcF family protein [Candidatus Liberibacter solanacearum]|uniref:YdcF family protein n=1 Tax=Candidatus Liberibacter solanacearum TaxID=556287 RepID=UPI00387DD1EC